LPCGKINVMPIAIFNGIFIGQDLFDHGNIRSQAINSELNEEMASELNDELITESLM